jgi:uncharacterized protein (TIRG00374 family)
MKLKKPVILSAKIIISGIILGYLFYLIPLKEIINSILRTNLFLFTAGILTAAPINYLSALETQYLTRIQGLKLSVMEILKIHLTTSFYGLFLPGISAGAVKWHKFSKFGKKSSAAAAIVLNRFLEVMMILFLGIIFSIPDFFSSGNAKVLVLLLIILIFMILLYLLVLNGAGLNLILRILFIIPLPVFVTERINKFSAAMLEFRNLSVKDHIEITGLLFLYHAIGVFSFFCFAESLEINLSIWAIGWIRSAMSLAIMLPFSFAGFGIREGSLVLLFGQYGIKPDVSMALSFLFFSRTIMTSLLGGMLEFKDFTMTKKIEGSESA